MPKHIFSTIVHWLGAGSEFGSYFGSVQRDNGTGAGPSIEESRRDFRAVYNTRARILG